MNNWLQTPPPIPPLMTSFLNFGSSSSSNTIPSLDTNSLFSNLKLATTFIIQPSQPQSHTLLTKRCKPAELGDLLMKKIKTKSSSDSNSNQQSPTIKENSDDNLSNCLESTSMIEDINSPSTKSFCEETEAHNAHRMLEGVLIPQRSISTPLVVNTFSLRHSKSDSADNHKRVQHALEVLQKKMFMEQQASLLKEIIFKCQAAQEPLIIPPLITASDSTTSPLTAGKSKKSPIQGFEDEDIIFGPVEYPLLSMAPPGFGGDFLQKELNTNAKASAKGLFGSLAATRAETQRSDSDEMSSCDSEESDVKRRRPRKTVNAKKAETGKGKKGDKKEKGQGKEKTKTRKQK